MAIDNKPQSGIDFSRTFGSQADREQNTTRSAGSSSARGDQPKAQFWLNIGYVAAAQGDDGDDRFVSLPVGIPLDTMEPVSTRSQNEGYRQFQAARNDLMEQIMSVANKLAPGQDRVLNLQIQLRRVAGEQAPVEAETNPFSRVLDL